MSPRKNTPKQETEKAPPGVYGPQKITFFASLPDIQNAISFRGNGDGGRAYLDVPRSDSGALLLLYQYGAGKLLRVTVEFVQPDDKPEGLNDVEPQQYIESGTPDDLDQILAGTASISDLLDKED